MIRVLGLQSRRDRVILTIWILGIFLLLTASASAVAGEYGGQKERAAVLALGLATPSLLALRGIPNGASLGSLMFFQTFAFLAVAVGLMNTFFATRHGRADEEQGRRELLVASPIGRSTPLFSQLLLGVAANVVLGALSVLGFVLGGMPFAGSLLAGTALVAVGLAFLGIGLLAGELAPTSRSANSIGVVAVLAAYALRGAGDALGTPDLRKLTLTPAWPSWLSPIGWGQQTFAFTDNRWWPVLLPLALALLAGAAAVVLHSRRELGVSLLPERAGRDTGGPTLRGDLGLIARLNRAGLIGWAVGAALLGLVVGSLASATATAALKDPSIQATLQSLAPGAPADQSGLLTSIIMNFVGMLAAVAGLQIVLRLRAEETEGRAEWVLASPLARRRWLLDAVLGGAVAVGVVVVVSGLAALVSFAGVGRADEGWRALGQALVELPAAFSVVAGAAVLLALLPRITTALSWAFYSLAVVIALFGELLKLSKPVLHASPFSNVPSIPVGDWGPTAILVAVDIVLVVIAAVLMRRRELST